MDKKNKPNNIISQYAASQIAGVSRQALNEMFKKGNQTFDFFTKDGQVDTSSPGWGAYLEERQNKTGSVAKSGKNNPKKQSKKQTGHGSLKQSRDEDDDQHESGWRREHALTGGFDPAMFTPSNPAQLKALTDIVARNLEIRIKLGDYLPREVVNQYLDVISQQIVQAVNLGRSVSIGICEKLDRVGMEKEVEKIINPKIKSIVEHIITACNNAKK